MRKSIHAALLLMTCAGLLAGNAGAQQTGTLKTITDTKTIRMGYLRESVPFSFVDQNGDPQGYSIELCKRVAAGVQQQLNLPDIAIKWIPVTLANRFDLVSSGGIDLECGTSTNSLSRQKQVDFSVMTWVDGGNFVFKASVGSDTWSRTMSLTAMALWFAGPPLLLFIVWLVTRRAPVAEREAERDYRIS